MLFDSPSVAKPAQERLVAGAGGGDRQGGRLAPAWLSVSIFFLATALALFSQHLGHPITAAILYLLGVTVVGGLQGMRGGLAAAFAACLVYNFFLSDPIFRFSLTSAEELVPLIAFNLSAAASAVVAGRLRERAVAAETANRRVNALLDVSHRLQAVAQVDQIPEAIAQFVEAKGAASCELYVLNKDALLPVQAERREGSALADRLFSEGSNQLPGDGAIALRLTTGAGDVGALVLTGFASSAEREQDLHAFLNLLGIALERCLLLGRLGEAELVRRSEEFKTVLLSSVSHDLRTPLSAISASASGLRRYGDDLPPGARTDLLATILEQCDRLNRYTTNLLNLVRLQAGVDASGFTECEALDVLGAAISRARAAAGAREIAKHYAVQGALVRADPLMLEQVFYNVLENAIRYTPAETPVQVRAWVGEERLRVEICDEGEGIQSQDSERVFERFYRSSTAAHTEGSGLGLSIAKGFTEAFGGTIGLNRTAGARGTTVEITLPLYQPDSQSR